MRGGCGTPDGIRIKVFCMSDDMYSIMLYNQENIMKSITIYKLTIDQTNLLFEGDASQFEAAFDISIANIDDFAYAVGAEVSQCHQ